ncbi:hypothetical protein CH340_25185, partial [Rhodoplanes serenus]
AAAAAGSDEIDALLATALRSASLKDAVASVVAATGSPRRTVYQRALALERRESHVSETGDDEP